MLKKNIPSVVTAARHNSAAGLQRLLPDCCMTVVRLLYEHFSYNSRTTEVEETANQGLVTEMRMAGAMERNSGA